MLSIVLLILKIIGIILASILGILLFVIALVLFVPIRYRVIANKNAELYANVKVSWLLRVIFFRLNYQNEKIEYCLRLFGYCIFSDQPKKRKKSRKKKVSKRNRSKKSQNTRQQSVNKESVVISENKEKILNNQEEPRENASGKQSLKGSKKLSIFARLNEKRKKTVSWIQGIKLKIRDILSKTKEIIRKLGTVKRFLQSRANHPGFKKIFQSVKLVCKHIIPTQLNLKLHFGTGDPCSTGQLLGIVCAIYPQMLANVQVIPNFEEEILEGNLVAKGRIRIFTLLRIAIKLYMDKEFKHVLKEFNHLKEEL